MLVNKKRKKKLIKEYEEYEKKKESKKNIIYSKYLKKQWNVGNLLRKASNINISLKVPNWEI